jgi:hypothetical protein
MAKYVHDRDEAGWQIGCIEDVPGVNCQERTKAELVASLRTTLVEAIDLNREDYA